ncbi:MAG TPA: glycerophosphodiester phosphodiesterase [Frankiaceae bacterium]|nr:glycerophosphodiester phosphodiesterase [Frankiaceae bacterium]
MSWPYLDAPAPIALAHRGGLEDGPENTMRAFAGAVRRGYRYLETDVHATADGVLLAFHDDRLDRVADRTGVIADLPYSEVRRARVDGEPVPLLEDLLAAWPDVRINIDIKAPNAIERLVETLDRTGARDRVCVGSFSQARLTRFRRLTHGRVCTSLGPMEVAALRVASYLPGRLPIPIRGAVAQVPVAGQLPVVGRLPIVDRRFLEDAHRRGVLVHVWTINEPDEMRRLLDLGVDGLITDRPSLLKSVLEQRAWW